MARFWPDKIIENIYFKEMASLVKKYRLVLTDVEVCVYFILVNHLVVFTML